MKDIRKACGHNSTPLTKWHPQSREKQIRKWMIGFFIGLIVLIELPSVSLGNGPELLPLPPGEKWRVEGEFLLRIKPAWTDTSQEILYETLRVTLYKISPFPSQCLDNAYFMSSHSKISEKDLKKFPLKISLDTIVGSPPKGKKDEITRGQGVIYVPATQSTIKVCIEEADQKHFEAFLETLTEERRQKLKKGISKGQSAIGFWMKNPQNPESCLWVEILNRAFIPLR